MKSCFRIRRDIPLFCLAIILFIANHSLAQIEWQKYSGNPVLDRGDNNEVLASSVIFDGEYKMWYAGDNLIYLATSADGINWTRYSSNPVLNVGIVGTWDYWFVSSPTVLFNGSIYEMWYHGSNGSVAQIGYATSPDGIHWTKHSANPVLNTGSYSEWDDYDVSSPMVYHNGIKYEMWYTGSGSGILKIGYASSYNGYEWIKYDNPITTVAPFSESDPVLQPGSIGTWDEGRVWAQAVLFNGSMYEMWYTGTDASGKHRIGYASSMDGIIWTKHTNSIGEPTYVLDRGIPGDWDAGWICAPSVLFDGNNYKMWYSGDNGTYLSIGYAISPDVSRALDHPWPMYQHDPQHTGRSEYVGPQTNEVKSSYKLTEASYFSSGPVISSTGTIYVGTSSGLLALKEEKGQLSKKWFYSCPRIETTPIIGSDSRILVYGAGKIIAISPIGSFEWEMDLVPCGQSFQLNISGDTVYYTANVGPENKPSLVALDETNGSILWHRELSQYTDGLFPTAPIVTKSELILVGVGSALLAFDVRGDLEWMKIFEADPSCDNCQPEVNCVLSDGNGIIYCIVVGTAKGFSNWCGEYRRDTLYAIFEASIDHTKVSLSESEIRCKYTDRMNKDEILVGGDGEVYFTISAFGGIECFSVRRLRMMTSDGVPSPILMGGIEIEQFYPKILDGNGNIYGEWGTNWIRGLILDENREWVSGGSGGGSHYFVSPYALSSNGTLYASDIYNLYAFGPPPPNQSPNQPTNVSPDNGATGVPITTTLQASPFSDPDSGDTHVASQWQVTTTPGHYLPPATYLYDSGIDNQHLTQITPPSLAFNTTYYWHVRYQDNRGAWSGWSTETSFTTFKPEFSFVHIADVHIGWEKLELVSPIGMMMLTGYTVFTATLQDIRNLPPSEKPNLVLISGDIVEYNKPEWFMQFKTAINKFTNDTGIQVYVVPGNHDRRTWIAGGDDNLTNYHTHITEIDDYSFEHNGYLFIGLDSGSDDLGGWESRQELIDYLFLEKGPEGKGISSDQMHYLGTQEQKVPKVIFMHHPVFTGKIDHGREDSSITDNRDNFITYCKENNIKLVLSGHTHQNHIFNVDRQEIEEQDINTNYPSFIQTASATKNGGDFKHGYRLFKIGGDVVSTEYRMTKDVPMYLAYTKGPATFNAYDSQGRHTGYGSVITEIPGSYYTGYYDASTLQAIALYNTNDAYIFEVEGLSEGIYSLDIASIKNTGSALFVAVDIPISLGGNHRYTINWDALSENEGVIVQIDANGDRTYEKAINTGAVYSLLKTFSITLDSGWNLISIPFEVADANILSILERIQGLYESVWAYDIQLGWRKYIPNDPIAFNSLENIEPGKGYLIYMNNPATLLIAGNELDTKDIQLFKGWNLVGYNSLMSQSPMNALASLPAGTCIYAYNSENETWLRYVVGDPKFLNNLNLLKPGCGYWIYVEQDCIWDINLQ